MAKILALDASTEACSAALYLDGVMSSDFKIAPRRHNELILPMIKRLLTKANMQLAELDAIAFGQGPGSFMGVRLATGVAQGLAFGADLPVIPISSLKALALAGFAATGQSHVIAAWDARMHEMYWGAYEFAENEIITHVPDSLCAPENLTVPHGPWLAVGNAWPVYAEKITKKTQVDLQMHSQLIHPHAIQIVMLAVKQYELKQTAVAHQAQPLYLRNKVADKPIE